MRQYRLLYSVIGRDSACTSSRGKTGAGAEIPTGLGVKALGLAVVNRVLLGLVDLLVGELVLEGPGAELALGALDDGLDVLPVSLDPPWASARCAQNQYLHHTWS